jgi:uncharacterized YccA/Bax inhibitor family protein
MWRGRVLKVVLALVGLLFVAGVYPLIGSLRHPAAYRSVIAFAAWSSFAHAVTMSTLGFEIASQKTGFLIGSAVLVVIGVALIALAPAKEAVAKVSTAVG